MFAKDKNKYPDGTAGILLLHVTVQKAEGGKEIKTQRQRVLKEM